MHRLNLLLPVEDASKFRMAFRTKVAVIVTLAKEVVIKYMRCPWPIPHTLPGDNCDSLVILHPSWRICQFTELQTGRQGGASS